jgi:Phosphoesterase family
MPSEATDPSVASYPINNLRFATPEIQLESTGVGANRSGFRPGRGRKPFRARQSKQSPLFTATRFKKSCGDRQGRGTVVTSLFFRHLLKKSPQWNDMVVIVTYDENGGFWDHVPPPQGPGWGVIVAIIA